jgi:PAS domain S-box-containing protein
VCAIVDLSARRRAEVALAESEARLAAAVRAGRFGAYDHDLKTGGSNWNEAAREIWGLSKDEPITLQTFLDGVDSDDRDAVRAATQAAFDPAGEGRFDLEYRVVNRRSGEVRWVHDTADVTFEDGRPVRVLGVAQDITQRKRAEARERLLLNEVNHRTKNLLAVIQAVARQSAKGQDLRGFLDQFMHRLQGIGANQDLLIRNEWEGVEIGELARGQLQPFGENVEARTATKGSIVRLTPASAQTIGMALHELATNAVKHGALSVATGRVAIDWSAEDGAFAMRWVESGGPEVKSPSRLGFGTSVITTMIESSLGGKVSLEYPPAGLVWRLSCPTERAIQD